MQSFRVAAAAVDSKPGETGRNLDRIAASCAKAASDGARLVLFPELSITGFVPNHPTGDHAAWLRNALHAARRMAEPVPGPAVRQLEQIAAAHGVYVCAGLLEDAGNMLHNAQVLAGPDGLAGVWRKMHVPMFEMPFYNGGPAPGVAATELGRMGVNICFDVLMPESARLLAVENVEVMLFPFAADPPPCTPEGWAAWAGPAVRARAVENGVFAVACNYAGRVECAGVEQHFPGGGMAVGPRGNVIAEWRGAPGEPHIMLADLCCEDLAAARAEPEYLFRFRRPELYGSLAQAFRNLTFAESGRPLKQ